MAQGRREVYKAFPEYKEFRDTRTMDQICKSAQQADFDLMTQQKFLRSYMRKYPDWDRLLLVHQIGSGKTCTAITMAEEYMAQHPEGKIRVILPARLRTNFIDELVSPCGMDKYISYSDFILYNAPETTEALKKRIKAQFMKKIQDKYDIMSFDRFKIHMESETLDEFIEKTRAFTENTMIIVDEVHNAFSDNHNMNRMQYILETGDMKKKIPGKNTVFFQLLSQFAAPTAKFVLLTATPVFDNINSIREVLRVMRPDLSLEEVRTMKNLATIIPLLKGKVSYFPGSSPASYPAQETQVHKIPYSSTQMRIYLGPTSDSDPVPGPVPGPKEDSEIEAFYAYQRQISLACLPDGMPIKTKKRIQKVISNMEEYCPKLKHCVEHIEAHPGKHFVYSNFVQHGLQILEEILKARGWVSYADVINDPKKMKKYAGKIFARWDGSVDDGQKMIIKSMVNRYENLSGDSIRVVLGSPSTREGISFKHMQHVHLLDKMWNPSARRQVEGRAIRYCSHIDIDPSVHAPLQRKVVIHHYHMFHGTPPDGMGIFVDDIMLGISDRKELGIQAAEKALQKVAIDYHLFKRMYREDTLSVTRSTNSYGIQDAPIDGYKYPGGLKCPKKRRPNPQCPDGYEEKEMKNTDEKCCYKIRTKRMF